MYQNTEVVWKPILGQGEVLYGLALSSHFAQRCLSVELSKAEQSELHDRLWELSKPKSWQHDYVPSCIFDWYENSLLPQAIYSRHAGSGKWLDTDTSSLGRINDEWAVTYSYHHADWDDMVRNLWLQYAFDWWSKLARVKLEN